MPASIASNSNFFQEDASSNHPSEFAVAPLRWPWATTRTAVLSGLLRLIPIPFLDDYLVGVQRRRLVKRLLLQNGVEYPNAAPRTLATWEEKSVGQKVQSLFKSLLVKPLKKIFRSVFFYLALRDAGRTAIETYLLGRTVNQFAKTDPVISESNQLTLYRSRRAANAFAVAIRSIDTELMKHLTARFWRAVKRHSDRLIRGRLTILPGHSRKQERDVIERAIENEAPGFIARFESKFEEQFTPSI